MCSSHTLDKKGYRNSLLISSIDISKSGLAENIQLYQFTKMLSTYYQIYLVVGISSAQFNLRSAFTSKLFRSISNLRVIVLPLLSRKYLRVLGELNFSFLASIIFLSLYLKSEVKAVFIRGNITATIVSFISKLVNVPLIYRAVGSPFTSYRLDILELPSFFSKITKVFMRIFDVIAFRRADRILVNSLSDKNLILSEVTIPKHKILFIPFPIPNFFFELKKSARARKKLSERKLKDIVLTYCGTFNIYYSFETLFRGILDLKSEGYHIKLTLYGRGPVREHISQQITELGLQENVMINDPVSRDKIPEIVRSADAVVVPLSNKLERGLPTKGIEAMALGVPIIISKRIDPLFINGENCVIVQDNSVEAWKTAIKKILVHDLREKLKDNGIKTAEAYHEKNMRDSLEQIIYS